METLLVVLLISVAIIGRWGLLYKARHQSACEALSYVLALGRYRYRASLYTILASGDSLQFLTQDRWSSSSDSGRAISELASKLSRRMDYYASYFDALSSQLSEVVQKTETLDVLRDFICECVVVNVRFLAYETYLDSDTHNLVGESLRKVLPSTIDKGAVGELAESRLLALRQLLRSADTADVMLTSERLVSSLRSFDSDTRQEIRDLLDKMSAAEITAHGREYVMLTRDSLIDCLRANSRLIVS